MIDRVLLFPYYLLLKIRHQMYDHDFILKTQSSDIPTISLGNITVGGTGKTPHTEMIIRLLKEKYLDHEIAVLSRGYKRKKKGYQVLPEGCSAFQYGDEPSQIKKKFPGVTVVVDKNRVRACSNIAGMTFAPKVIVLDDAFQYRALRPTLSIVLVDYNRPLDKDRLLPLGSLRDLPESISRAHVVIVTKCSPYVDEDEKQQWAGRLGVNREALFFTTLEYRNAEKVFACADQRYVYSKRAIMVTGIANDTPLRNYLSDSYQIVERYKFADHHRFSMADIRIIESAVKRWPTAAIITTEKDAQRLVDCKNLPSIIKERLFAIPVEPSFMDNDEQIRFAQILSDF